MEYKNTGIGVLGALLENCLNPCSNGIQKYLKQRRVVQRHRRVLILVLMEYKNTMKKNMLFIVVILS